jgi:hypothetical protein
MGKIMDDLEIIKLAHDFSELYASYLKLVEVYNSSASVVPAECGDALNKDFANVFYNLAKKIVEAKEN